MLDINLLQGGMILWGVLMIALLAHVFVRLAHYIRKSRRARIQAKSIQDAARAKQAKQVKQNPTKDTIDPLDRFAGLVKPEGALDAEPPTDQKELIIETISELPQQSDDTSESELSSSSHSTADTTRKSVDPVVAAQTTYKHQDQLNKLRAQALTAKEKGQLKLYEQKLIEGLAIEPQYPPFLGLLADHYFHTNHYKKALTLLKRLLDHDKENHRAMRQMGEIYLSHGDIKTAEIMIEQAVKYQNNNPRYLYSLVDIKYNTDKIDDAIFLMEKILKLRPTNVEYLVATAMLYEQKGEIERAKRYYAIIMEYDPDNRTAKRKLKEL